MCYSKEYIFMYINFDDILYYKPFLNQFVFLGNYDANIIKNGFSFVSVIRCLNIEKSFMYDI